MKKTLKLIPALCMLLISAMVLGTSTYAWFSMSNSVSANNMKVTAKADSGIVIKCTDILESAAQVNAGQTITIPTAAASFSNIADVDAIAAKALLPVTTINATAWYSASSTDPDDAQAHQAGSGYTNRTNDLNDYVAQFTYVIRSAAEAVAVDNVDLAISQLTVTPSGAVSENLNKAIRVAVVINGTVHIYAPLQTADITVAPGYTNDTAVAYHEITGQASFSLTGHTIPANDNGIEVQVYIYYDGEDANCKSQNITAAFDNITVSMTFQTIAYTAPAEP